MSGFGQPSFGRFFLRAYTNTVERFFSLLKRGIKGSYHSVSKKHLHRYVSGFQYRWNTRDLEDGKRTEKLIQRSVGKRIMYRDPAFKE